MIDQEPTLSRADTDYVRATYHHRRAIDGQTHRMAAWGTWDALRALYAEQIARAVARGQQPDPLDVARFVTLSEHREQRVRIATRQLTAARSAAR